MSSVSPSPAPVSLFQLVISSPYLTERMNALIPRDLIGNSMELERRQAYYLERYPNAQREVTSALQDLISSSPEISERNARNIIDRWIQWVQTNHAGYFRMEARPANQPPTGEIANRATIIFQGVVNSLIQAYNFQFTYNDIMGKLSTYLNRNRNIAEQYHLYFD